MGKHTLCVALFIGIANIAFACDVCGAGAMSQNGGLIPFYYKNYVKAGWYHTPFETINEYGDNTRDYFHTGEISLRYHFNARWKANLHQPFQFNFRESEEGNFSLNGLGDTRLTTFYALFNRMKISESSTLSAEAGVGLIMPFGKYDPNIHSTEGLPENFNPGNGNWGTFLQTNWFWQTQKFGLSTNVTCVLKSKTSTGYQFGNQTATNLLVFINKKANGWSWMPFAGWYQEFVAADTYANGNPVLGTGGMGGFLQFGVNIFRKEWLFALNCSQPLTHDYASNEVIPKTRFSIDLTYFFKR